MKRTRLLPVLGLALALLFLPACAFVMSPLYGGVFTDAKYGWNATSNTGMMKHGEAMAQSVLGLVATGDASISAASAAGGITKIHHVDYHAWSILGIYAKFTTHVYGE